jgi:circadian clock protein KaiC
MRSIGLDLAPLVDAGLLRFHAARPNLYGLEMHLVMMARHVREFRPHVVIVDPVTDLTAVGDEAEVKAALTRLIDYLKSNQITALFTSLTGGGSAHEETTVGISSLMDTWILLKIVESNGERNRALYVLKSRGMEHSNQIREFQLTGQGIRLLDVPLGTAGPLMGSARTAHIVEVGSQFLARQQELSRMQRELERKRMALEAQIQGLRAEFSTQEDELAQLLAATEPGEQTIRQTVQEGAEDQHNAGNDNQRGDGT